MNPRESSGRPKPVAWAALMLAAVTLLLHLSALKGHWRIDDPLVLLYVVDFPSSWGYFFSPSQWKSLGVPFFTPWLVLDYRLDFGVFGLQPQAFYAHHLIVIWFASLLTFILLEPHAGPWISGLACVLFLAGSPTEVVAQQLMSRHYPTGLAFAIGAMLLWQRAALTGRQALAWLGALCYLLAMLNKEVFAPLPIVLPFLVDTPLRRRMSALVPYAVTGILFLAWRTLMLGQVIGGYDGNLQAAGALGTSLLLIPEILFGKGWFTVAGVSVLIVTLGSWAALSARRWMALICGVLALSLPFLAVSVSPHVSLLRFVFVPWWALCVAMAVATGARLNSGTMQREHGPSSQARGLALAGIVSISFLSLQESLTTASRSAAHHIPYDVQGRFIWANDASHSYVPRGDLEGTLQFQYASAMLKARITGQDAPLPIPFAASAPALSAPPSILAYDKECDCMRNVAAPSQDELQPTNIPLTLFLDRSRPGLAWRFDTTASAACFLVFPSLRVALTAPCQGSMRYELPAWVKGSFRAMVRTPQGQWNLSTPLSFPDRGQTLCWANAAKCAPDPQSTAPHQS